MLDLAAALRSASCVALTVAVTASLWYEKDVAHQAWISIFLYLVPIVLIAASFGTFPAIVAMITVTASAPFLLYEPLYSWRIASPLGGIDIFWFDLLALAAIKCIVELLRPTKGMPRPRRAKQPASNSGYCSTDGRR